MALKITLSTNLREFQYKILNKILYNNEKLFKFKKVDSGLCAIYAKLTRLEIFFQQKVSWTRPLGIQDVLFGILDPHEFHVLTNYIILESKYFLYLCKLNSRPLSVRSLLQRIKNTYEFERYIARSKGKISLHNKKWDPILPLISP